MSCPERRSVRGEIEAETTKGLFASWAEKNNILGPGAVAFSSGRPEATCHSPDINEVPKLARIMEAREVAMLFFVLKPCNTFCPLSMSGLTRSSPKRPIQLEGWPALFAALRLERAVGSAWKNRIPPWHSGGEIGGGWVVEDPSRGGSASSPIRLRARRP